MKYIAFSADLDLYVIHVSRKYIQQQGIDIFSREGKGQGVVKGTHMNNFIPLYLKLIERNQEFKSLINNIVHGMNFCWLKIKDWFKEHHCKGIFIWYVSPKAKEVVYKMLDKARLKDPILCTSL